MSEKLRKGHKACCAAVWCYNSGRNSTAKFFRFPADDRCDIWLKYAKRGDLAGLTRQEIYNGYRLCSDHFTESAYADPARTRLLWTAVPTVAVEVGSQIDEGPFRKEVTAASAQDHPGQNSVATVAGSTQTPVLPESPVPGPSGLAAYSRSDECVPCPETPGQERPPSTPPHRGRKRKVYTPKTGAVIKRLRNDTQRYRKSARLKSRRKITTREALERLKPHVSPEFYKLLGSQVALHCRKRKGRRWSRGVKEFALNMYFHGPSSYRQLSKALALPSPRSLRRWLSEIPMAPGIISNVLDILKDVVKNWPIEDRACIIAFDEMSVRPNLQYDTKHDVVVGFSDDGSERTTAVANVAFVALLCGISRSWVIPVAFAVAKKALCAEKIQRLLLALIAQLAECELYVKATVCDQGSHNIKLFHELAATPQNPYFEVNGHKVYFLFDTPHLLKCTRNNLRAPHKLYIGTEIVDWGYICELYESSDPLRLKLARKLTSDHIYKRPFNSMKVKFATQVLSESVSVAMSVMIALGKLPATAKSTADFIENMDKLFDCLNSKTAAASTPGKMNYALSASSKHLAFLREAIKWISCWRFDSPRQPHTIRGWLVTIQATLMLWEDLHQNFNFTCLLTRRLQQDPLENLFGTLRQKHGCNEHPNVFQFIAALKHVFVGKLHNLSSRGNCEVVDSHLLTRLSVGEPKTQQAFVTETLFPSETAGEDLLDITEENALYCFAGGIAQRFLEKRPADCVCEPFLRSGDRAFSGSHQTLAMLQSHGKQGGLFANMTLPSAVFFEAVKDMENCFVEHIGVVAHLCRVTTVLKDKLNSSLPKEIFCSEKCRIDLLRQFCHARLMLHINDINRVLKKQRERKSAAKRKLQKLQN